MVTQAENELMTRIEGDAPMGRLMREHAWIPFALSSHLVHDDGPLPVRLFGRNYVAFRAEDGRLGFLDELCPHRRASLVLGRLEGNCLRCIYHGWKIDVSGCVAEAPTQLVRPERFAASVPVVHFPVHEVGGLVWVWLGGTEPPPFPELPFDGDWVHAQWCASRVPCNWLQGIEGTVDSVHVQMLHQSWIAASAELEEYPNLNYALDQPPTYETESTPYGMRAAALRRNTDGSTYVRITEHLMPLVTVVATGKGQARSGTVFAISPVDDAHHILFFGYFQDTPTPSPVEIRVQSPDVVPDPLDYTGLQGDRSNRWGQDRALMNAGHFTGFGRTLLEEDVAVQTSMGPILDRTKEHLSSSDVAVAHLRRMLLDALRAAESGARPPGSVWSPGGVRLPNALEVVLGEGERWEDVALDQVAG